MTILTPKLKFKEETGKFESEGSTITFCRRIKWFFPYLDACSEFCIRVTDYEPTGNSACISLTWDTKKHKVKFVRNGRTVNFAESVTSFLESQQEFTKLFPCKEAVVKDFYISTV